MEPRTVRTSRPWGWNVAVLAAFGLGLGMDWLVGGSAPDAAPTPPAARPAAPARPPASAGPQVKAVPTPGHFFVVTPGTTLSEVSKRAYGTVRRVGDLLAANPGLDPAHLKTSTPLYVPVGAEPAPPAR